MRTKITTRAITMAKKKRSAFKPALDRLARHGITPEAFIPKVDTKIPNRSINLVEHKLAKQGHSGVTISVTAPNKDVLMNLKSGYSGHDLIDSSRRITPGTVDELLSRL